MSAYCDDEDRAELEADAQIRERPHAAFVSDLKTGPPLYKRFETAVSIMRRRRIRDRTVTYLHPTCIQPARSDRPALQLRRGSHRTHRRPLDRVHPARRLER